MPLTDHHIQDKIIAALVSGDRRFSELVPENMEHSLFMYHMRKLLKQEIIEKDDQLYRLTLKGAQMYNARHQLGKPLRYPRALIQFLVVRDGEVLLSRRTTALANQLNEYMLPGGVHYFMTPSRTAASRIAKSRGLTAGEFVGTLETIAPKREFHGLIDIYRAEYARDKPCDADFELAWLPLEDAAAMDFARAGSAPYIVTRHLENDLLPRMTFVVPDDSQTRV